MCYSVKGFTDRHFFDRGLAENLAYQKPPQHDTSFPHSIVRFHLGGCGVHQETDFCGILADVRNVG